MQHWSVLDLQTQLQTHTPVLLDVREPWEYDTCYLPNSILIPMGDIPNRLDTLDPEVQTVVICHHGIRSRQVGIYLEHNNFKHIINLSGGMDAWARTIDPTMAVYT